MAKIVVKINNNNIIIIINAFCQGTVYFENINKYNKLFR